MIWLIGNKGMLGSEVEHKLKAENLQYSASDVEVDITSKDALKNYASGIFNGTEPNWIINCSAYTAVDRAEDEPGLAGKINRDGVKNIAEIAAGFNARLIHISTDYVFDGTSPEPLTEEMMTGPVCVYGRTKLEGEEAVKKAVDSYFIIRTAWLYGLSGANFVYTMLKLMNERETISVVNDQHGSPTNASDLASLIALIIKQNSTDYGIYHYSNEGNISWFDFASAIYSIGCEMGLITSECRVNPCGSDEYPSKAKRPKYSLLSKEKVKNTFGADAPQWRASLLNFMTKLKENK